MSGRAVPFVLGFATVAVLHSLGLLDGVSAVVERGLIASAHGAEATSGAIWQMGAPDATAPAALAPAVDVVNTVGAPAQIVLAAAALGVVALLHRKREGAIVAPAFAALAVAGVLLFVAFPHWYWPGSSDGGGLIDPPGGCRDCIQAGP